VKRILIVALMVLALACRERGAHRVIFVGLDGADWRLIDRFTADGTMPQLASILSKSERRVLLTQQPPLSPLVWTSMMTGVSPLEHRILDFTRFNPRTHEREPITSDERARPAIWNMAASKKKRAGVFGLWATAPAEDGVIVTDRDVPRDVNAATEFIRARSLEWIRANKPDLAIVYFQGTDEIGHLTSGDVEKSRDYFRRIDAILGEFRELASDLDAELVIASDHGFDWGGHHEASSVAVATAGKWHRDEGIFVRWPRNAVTDTPARVDQICATLLEMLDMPRGEGLAPAIGATKQRETFNYRRIFRRASGEVKASDEAVSKLKALGYIDGGTPTNITSTRTPASFNNEGLILRAAGRNAEAEKAFRAAIAIDPAYASALLNLSELVQDDVLLLAAWKAGHPEAPQHIVERARERGGDLALLTRAIEIRDDDSLRIYRGRYRLEGGDCRGALDDFRAMRRESDLRSLSITAAEGCVRDMLSGNQ